MMHVPPHDSRNRRARLSPPKYYSPETDPFGTMLGIFLGAGFVGVLWLLAEIYKASS